MLGHFITNDWMNSRMMLTSVIYCSCFTFTHLSDAFIQSDLHCIQVTVLHFYQLLLSLGIEPMILALLAPCSTIWATESFTVNSHYKVIFNCATVRNVLVYYCDCFEVIIMVIGDHICLGSWTLYIHIQIVKCHVRSDKLKHLSKRWTS